MLFNSLHSHCGLVLPRGNRHRRESSHRNKSTLCYFLHQNYTAYNYIKIVKLSVCDISVPFLTLSKMLYIQI